MLAFIGFVTATTKNVVVNLGSGLEHASKYKDSHGWDDVVTVLQSKKFVKYAKLLKHGYVLYGML